MANPEAASPIWLEGRRDTWRRVRPLPQPEATTANRSPDGSKVRVEVGGKLRGGEIVSFEGRSQRPTWVVRYDPADKSDGATGLRLFSANDIRYPAPDPDAFPVGSRVPVKFAARVLDGSVIEFNPTRGWKVSIELPGPNRGSGDMWIGPRSVQQLTMIDPTNLDTPSEAPKKQPAAEKSGAPFPVGSVIHAEVRGVAVQATVLEMRGDGRRRMYRVELKAEGQETAQRWLPARALEAIETYE